MQLRSRKAVSSEEAAEEEDLSKAHDTSVEQVSMTTIGNGGCPSEKTLGGLEGDYLNVLLLLGLYVLQGIPLGMAGSMPMILQSKNISYSQQAMFSFVFWPFSVKLLWAPIVDAMFVSRFGRRKTWLVPTQYLIAAFMIMLSFNIDNLLDAEVPNILLMTIMFFSLNFLAATQDIAVDGWALTMLSKRNVRYASTCNSVGQTAGYFLGNVVLLAFSSAEFSNKYLRSVPQTTGVLTLAGFLFFWGIVFVLTTTAIWFFKSEQNTRDGDEDEENHGVLGTYRLLFKILQLPAIKELIIILLTVKVGFAATDAVTGLKLIEAGVKKESLALLAVPLTPLQILLPLAISKFTTGPRPLDVMKKAIPCRLAFGVVFAGLVRWTQYIRVDGQEDFPGYYYATILLLFALHQVSLYCMFVSLMAFHAGISDARIGGTYMTLLNTLSNLGGTWPSTLALYFVEPLTWKTCTGVPQPFECSSVEAAKLCTESGGVCSTTVDGYYVETFVCVFLGCLWLVWRRGSLTRLQNKKEEAWRVT